MRRTVALLSLCLMPCVMAQKAVTKSTAKSYPARIEQKLAGFPGKVAIYAKNLKTGEEYGLNQDERVRTASTIKLPIMVQAFTAVQQGKLGWNDEITLHAEDKVSGSGVLAGFTDDAKLRFRDLVYLMIVLSDNTATNLVLDQISAQAVNERMDEYGLKQTRALRKILSGSKPAKGFSEAGKLPENERFGLGVSTPREMVTLLEKIYRGEAVNKEASDEMLSILKKQHDHTGIGRSLRETTIASKSGALDHLRSDVALVYAPNGPVAMAITVDDIPEVDYTDDNRGSLLIAALSDTLLEGLAGFREAHAKK